MKTQFSIRCFVIVLCILMAVPAGADVASLQPGSSVTIDCVKGNVLTKKATTPTGSETVSARATFSLDSTGTILTINLQNTSTTPGAVLYAFDLGLPRKFSTTNRMEASFSGFPTGARWLGPTDSSGPTNETGAATFATRETIARRMDEYLNRQTSLSAGFLSAGQGGNITVKFILNAEAKNKPLQLDPVAYFLMNDPNAQDKRIQIVSTGVVKAK